MTEIHGVGEDPRVSEEYVHRVAGKDGEGDVLLLGVVHDHPSSRHRVKEVVTGYEPDVLALEVAPLALSLFEAVALGESWAPTAGDEMSDAIAAAPDARAVGIDGLDAGFFVTLTRAVYRERPSLSAVRALKRSVTAVAKEAVTYRLATVLGRHTSLRLSVGNPIEHDCDPMDPPAMQAADERRQTATSLAFLRSVQLPPQLAIRDEVREACMVRRLERLRQDGDVAAVVGLGHVEPLARELEGPDGEDPSF